MKVYNTQQPHPQGSSLKKWVGREKVLASAGHVSPRTPQNPGCNQEPIKAPGVIN